MILEATLNNGEKGQFNVSKSWIKSTHGVFHKKQNTYRFYFYLNDKTNGIELNETMRLAKDEIPTDFFDSKWSANILPHKKKSELMARGGVY